MKVKELTCKITLHATGYGHAFLKSLDWKCAYCDKQDVLWNHMKVMTLEETTAMLDRTGYRYEVVDGNVHVLGRVNEA